MVEKGGVIYLTLQEVALELGVTPNCLYERIRRGNCPPPVVRASEVLDAPLPGRDAWLLSSEAFESWREKEYSMSRRW